MFWGTGLELLQQIPGNPGETWMPSARGTCSGHRIPGWSCFLAAVWLCHPAFWLPWFSLISWGWHWGSLVCDESHFSYYFQDSLLVFKLITIKNCLRWISLSSSPEKALPTHLWMILTSAQTETKAKTKAVKWLSAEATPKRYTAVLVAYWSAHDWTLAAKRIKQE